jgi:hypothetical protein
MASVKTKSEIRCEDGAMTLFYQTGLWLSSLAPGEKVRFYRGRDAFTDSVANGDGRIEFFTETSAWKVPEISLVHGEDSSAWSPLDSMYTESAGYSPVKFSLALFTDSAHGGVKHYDYSLLASDTAARRIPCGTGYFGSTWSATDTLNLPITRLIMDVTWDGWANSSLIELGIPDKVTGRDSIFLMERNNFPVIYDAPNPMRRIKSSIWSEIKAQPMIVAIGLGTEEFRILIRNEGLAE